jgi:serine protease Do
MVNTLRFATAVLAILIIGKGGVTQAFEMQAPGSAVEIAWFSQVEWQVRSDGTTSLVIRRLNSNSDLKYWDLRAGDRVVAFAGVTISSPTELQTLSDGLAPESWRLTVLRESHLIDLQPMLETISGTAVPDDIHIAEQNTETLAAPTTPTKDVSSPPSTLPAGVSQWALGFETLTFCPEIWTGLETPVLSGALIRTVLHGSMAAQAGLIPGAIIVAVDGKRIDSANELTEHLDAKTHPLPFAVLAYHGRTLKQHRFGDFEKLETPLANPLPKEQELPPQVIEPLPFSANRTQTLEPIDSDTIQGNKEDFTGPKLVEPRQSSPEPLNLEQEISTVERELREQEAVVRRLKAQLRELHNLSQGDSR